MKDTPTIDLDQIILDFWLNATNSSTPQPYQTAKGQAKQALLQWHKDKARSYIELLESDLKKFEELWEVWGVEYGIDLNMEAIEDILKSIEEDKI